MPIIKFEVLFNFIIYSTKYFLQTALNFKILLDRWNVKTSQWLRFTVYRRVPIFKTLSVYAVSALWHGFYPGYYISFGCGAILTITGRQIHRQFRPFFQKRKLRKVLYDIFSLFVTKAISTYAICPFILLDAEKSLQLYK